MARTSKLRTRCSCSFAGLALEPADVVFELSERDATPSADGVLRRIESVPGAKGFSGLALDDVGTGCDSRDIVKQGRPDYLKLDTSLVRGIHSNLDPAGGAELARS